MNTTQSRKPVFIAISLLTLCLGAVMTQSAYAEDCFLDIDDDNVGDNTGGANSDGDDSRLACGDGASALDTNSTAVGSDSGAWGDDSVAVGTFSRAQGGNSTAIGRSAVAVGGDGTTVGAFSGAPGQNATAVGKTARARSLGATALGGGSEIDTDSPGAIAIGYQSEIDETAPGAIAIGGDSNNSGPGAQALGAHAIALGDEARIDTPAVGGIAIGGDVDGDGVGAQVTAPGAIALGADVVADVADNLFIGIPVRVIRDDPAPSEKEMMKLVNNGGVNFKLEDTTGFGNPSGNGEWTFRTGTNGSKFVIGKTGTSVQEFQVFSGGNARLAGTLTQGSSRTKKENFVAIDPQAILAKVLALPISQWNYIHDNDDIRHIGPMAEDFHSLFQLGQGPKTISSLDTSGIAFAAIKALKQQLDENDQVMKKRDVMIEAMQQAISDKDTKIAKQSQRIVDLEQRVNELSAQRVRVDTLEQVVIQLVFNQSEQIRQAALMQ